MPRTTRPSALPDELIKARRRTGLSQQKMADLLGVHVRTVSYWEHGGRSVPRYFLLALAYVEEHGVADATERMNG